MTPSPEPLAAPGAEEPGQTAAAERGPVTIALTENLFEALEGGNFRYYGTIVNLWDESLDAIHVEVTLLDVFDDPVNSQDIRTVPDVIMPEV